MSLTMTSEPSTNTRSQQRVRHMSNEELSQSLTRCEDAIAAGTAEISDYETFVLCQRELSRRTWS